MGFLTRQEIESLTHELTEKFVSDRYSDELEYFPVVWDQLATARDRIWAGGSIERITVSKLGLPYEGENSLDLEVIPATLVVSAVLCELNSRGRLPDASQIEQAILACGGIFGASQRLSKNIVQHIGPQMLALFERVRSTKPLSDRLPKDECVIWSSDLPADHRIPGIYLSVSDAEKQYGSRAADFHIFIQGQTVYATIKPNANKETHQRISLTDHAYRLLVLLLRYKERHLPLTASHDKVWFPRAATPNTGSVDVVNERLKFPISELRKKFRPIRQFNIPHKEHSSGYLCEGNFSYCVIIGRQLESEFTLKIS